MCLVLVVLVRASENLDNAVVLQQFLGAAALRGGLTILLPGSLWLVVLRDDDVRVGFDIDLISATLFHHGAVLLSD